MQKLSLHRLHQSYNARFMELNGRLIPADYGDVAGEIHAAMNSLAITDRSYLGKILMHGSDALQLLNLISTNDMNKLLGSAVCDTLFNTPKGNIVDYCRILNLGSAFLLISSYPGNAHLQEWVSRFITTENVEIQDVSNEFIWLTVLGPSSAEFFYLLSGEEISRADETIWMPFADDEFPALRNDNLLVPAYNICLPAETGNEFTAWVMDKILISGGSLMGNNAFQVIRLESGMPDWGTELTDEYNAHEAQLLNAVSFTKGAFTGQEALAWLDTNDRVQRYLMIIDIHGPLHDEPPLDILYENEIIGRLTSYAYDPLNERHVGLGYIKKSYAVEDFNLLVEVHETKRCIPADLRLPPGNR